MPATAPKQLEHALRDRIPRARLVQTPLPDCPALKLWLLDGNYPQWELAPEDAAALMEAPPFWSFCWASGQVLAQFLLQNPQYVRGKTVLDFGSGSGVVAIAAKLAGAKRCWALDSDKMARSACTANARLNNVEIETAGSLHAVHEADLVTLADVFYDADNLPLLPRLRRNYAALLVADSRRKPEDFAGLELLGQLRSHTVPDLDETSAFNNVRIYHS